MAILTVAETAPFKITDKNKGKNPGSAAFVLRGVQDEVANVIQTSSQNV